MCKYITIYVCTMEYGGHQVRGTKTLRNLATDPGSSIWNLDDTAVPSQSRLRRPFFWEVHT